MAKKKQKKHDGVGLTGSNLLNALEGDEIRRSTERTSFESFTAPSNASPNSLTPKQLEEAEGLKLGKNSAFEKATWNKVPESLRPLTMEFAEAILSQQGKLFDKAPFISKSELASAASVTANIMAPLIDQVDGANLKEEIDKINDYNEDFSVAAKKFIKKNPNDFSFVSVASYYFSFVIASNTFQPTLMNLASGDLAKISPIKIVNGLTVFSIQTLVARWLIDKYAKKNSRLSRILGSPFRAALLITLTTNGLASFLETGVDSGLALFLSDSRMPDGQLVKTGVALPTASSIPLDGVVQGKDYLVDGLEEMFIDAGYPNTGHAFAFTADFIIMNGYNYGKFEYFVNVDSGLNIREGEQSEGSGIAIGGGPKTYFPFIPFSKYELNREVTAWCESYLVEVATTTQLEQYVNLNTVALEAALTCSRRKGVAAKNCADTLSLHYANLTSAYPEISINASQFVEPLYQSLCEGSNPTGLECQRRINFDLVPKLFSEQTVIDELQTFCSNRDTSAQGCTDSIVGYVLQATDVFNLTQNPHQQAMQLCISNANGTVWSATAELPGVPPLEGNLSDAAELFVTYLASSIVVVSLLLGAGRKWQGRHPDKEKIKAGYMKDLGLDPNLSSSTKLDNLKQAMLLKSVRDGLIKLHGERPIHPSETHERILNLMDEEMKKFIIKNPIVPSSISHLELQNLANVQNTQTGSSSQQAGPSSPQLQLENIRSEEFEPPILKEQAAKGLTNSYNDLLKGLAAVSDSQVVQGKRTGQPKEYSTRLSDSGGDYKKFTEANADKKEPSMQGDRPSKETLKNTSYIDKTKLNKEIDKKRETKDRKKGKRM